MNNKQVIVICGPTASGKTDIASRLCELIGGEIISADSRQVYRFLDIGTNKSGAYDAVKRVRNTSEGIPQHLTDILDPDETFSAGDFAQAASHLIKEIHAEKKIPVVAGGTGLYIKALVNGLAPLPPKNDGVRAALNREIETHGLEHLYKKLKTIDPASAEKNRSNPQRIIRALEIYELTGKPITELHAGTIKPEWQFIQFAPEWGREELYANIEERTDAMLKNGMAEETKVLLSEGYAKACPAFGSLGYKHVINHLSGALTLEETAKLISLDTRHYAKRQLTWFRGAENLRWIKISKKSFDPSNIASNIAKEVNNML